MGGMNKRITKLVRGYSEVNGRGQVFLELKVVAIEDDEPKVDILKKELGELPLNKLSGFLFH